MPESTSKMQTYIRVRPCKKAKGDRPAEVSVLTCEPRIGNSIATPTIPDGVSFPAVFGPESTQRDVFVTCGLPMLEAALEGVNSLLFAYGQTGSGKTFSMLGADGGSNPLLLDGIVPQMSGEILRRFSQLEKQSSGAVKCKLWVRHLMDSNKSATVRTGRRKSLSLPPLRRRLDRL